MSVAALAMYLSCKLAASVDQMPKPSCRTLCWLITLLSCWC